MEPSDGSSCTLIRAARSSSSRVRGKLTSRDIEEVACVVDSTIDSSVVHGPHNKGVGGGGGGDGGDGNDGNGNTSADDDDDDDGGDDVGSGVSMISINSFNPWVMQQSNSSN